MNQKPAWEALLDYLSVSESVDIGILGTTHKTRMEQLEPVFQELLDAVIEESRDAELALDGEDAAFMMPDAGNVVVGPWPGSGANV